MKARSRNKTLQGKGRRSGTSIPAGERLIDEWYDQRAGGGFEHGHHNHRDSRSNERAGVRK